MFDTIVAVVVIALVFGAGRHLGYRRAAHEVTEFLGRNAFTYYMFGKSQLVVANPETYRKLISDRDSLIQLHSDLKAEHAGLVDLVAKVKADLP